MEPLHYLVQLLSIGTIFLRLPTSWWIFYLFGDTSKLVRFDYFKFKKTCNLQKLNSQNALQNAPADGRRQIVREPFQQKTFQASFEIQSREKIISFSSCLKNVTAAVRSRK